MKIFWITTLFALTALACSESSSEAQQELPVEPTPVEVQPLVVTEPVPNDSDDPAIWINPTDVMGSLIIGADKDSIGGLYVFDLDGKLVNQSLPLGRPNNVDVGYGFSLNGTNVDFVVTGERFTSSIRIFSLPDLKAIKHVMRSASSHGRVAQKVPTTILKSALYEWQLATAMAANSPAKPSTANFPEVCS